MMLDTKMVSTLNDWSMQIKNGKRVKVIIDMGLLDIS